MGRFQVLSLVFCNVSRLWYISALCKSEQVRKFKAVMCNQGEIQPNNIGNKIYNHVYCTVVSHVKRRYK